MKQKKDRSMLYAVLAGFGLFVACAVLMRALQQTKWLLVADISPIVYTSELPEGTQYDLWEPPRSWMGDGVTTLTAQIPAEAAEGFGQKLRDEGYAEGPLPEKIWEQIRGSRDTDIIPDTDGGLWWFLDETDDGPNAWGHYANYTLCFYDPETCTYYYIEYDS